MSRLEDNLYSKRILKFKNGKFRVLVLSDIHGIKNYDTRLIRDLDAILDGVKPDVVLLNGDVGWKDAVDGKHHLFPVRHLQSEGGFNCADSKALQIRTD